MLAASRLAGLSALGAHYAGVKWRATVSPDDEAAGDTDWRDVVIDDHRAARSQAFRSAALGRIIDRAISSWRRMASRQLRQLLSFARPRDVALRSPRPALVARIARRLGLPDRFRAASGWHLDEDDRRVGGVVSAIAVGHGVVSGRRSLISRRQFGRDTGAPGVYIVG